MDATARITNIHRSFNAFVKTYLETALSLDVRYGYEKGADRDVSGLNEWLSILWITEDPGSKSVIELQVNCVVREGALALDLLSDKVASVLPERTRIPFYDYSSSVVSPTLVGGMVLERMTPAARDLPEGKDGLLERVLEYEMYIGRKT